ncbi:ABC transporter ATP-binding protein [Pasteurellaceae bacterium 20609_3]|uniref:ABC transporter ATP-binding protein n=1 Tax=Spirabiliibacterium mucosae TaxID=28156 RepID=UPI001AAC4680|nr:ABC transporter ATP-binding protein [Spirabiliibacterium mucosae]MBE2898538.1 ABC transporter ATP-binding protein [Spirabiliibacterium mucosae]
MTDLLTINSLNVRYQNTPVLENLDLQLKRGEILCLLGASGCGKTTLLKAIAGLIDADGAIVLNGQNVSHKASADRGVGLIFQDYALFPHLTVAQNIAFGLSALNAQQREDTVAEMLNLVGLGAFRDKFPHQLSGGQQQRVAIARSLACRPQLLLLDEPFSNIDTQVRLQLIEEIKSILKSQSMAAIFVTHSKEEAFLFADTLALMAHGRIVQTGSPSALYQHPNSRFVAEFLGHGDYLPVQVTSSHSLSSPVGELHFDNALHKADQSAVKVGESLDCLVRAQQWQVRECPTGAGEVVKSRFLGHTFALEIAFAGQTWLAYTNAPQAVGTRVALEASLARAILFDKK